MKEAKCFIEKKIRVEGQSLTKAEVADIMKKMFGSEARIVAIDAQTAYTLVTVWDYLSSHVV